MAGKPQKNLAYSVLLDFYGPVLTDKQRVILTEYYDEDLSLKNTNLCLTSFREMRVIHKCSISVHTLTAQIALPTTTSSIWPLVIR